MPRATVSTQPERRELKSLEGGFVVLRRMTYGEKLHRQELAVHNTAEASRGSRDSLQMTIAMMQRKVAEWEFGNLILEHNLEDENGVMLNFKNRQALDMLDPIVGDEINTYIGEMNNFEEDDQRGN